eukprot:TRINITY_DN3753_c0_g1_i1.p1 TRINITY_DN3753_c0_g1~~TRINITY_DN3753_c0_g1_i1.p1  ORF type:complete len:439 (+),score=75.87 TRINITY_DN3753_c0_g1_i1:528-1844(+)
MNPIWQVVAGDESEEIKTQSQRELRNLEAVYPRLSAIPQCPSEPQDAPESNDLLDPPQIPLVPIEEEEDGLQEVVTAGLDSNQQGEATVPSNEMWLQSVVSGSSTTKFDQTFNTQISQSDATKTEIAAAAATVFEAVMRSNDQGSMIDQDLLIKFLSNPKIVETLIGQDQKNINDKNRTADSTMEINSNLLLHYQKHNDVMPVHKHECETNFPISCQPAIPPSVNPLLNNNKFYVSEGLSNQSNSSQVFAAPQMSTQKNESFEFTNSRANIPPMSSMIPAQLTAMHQSSQAVSRSGILTGGPVVVSNSTQPNTSASDKTSSINEQYYKNLIQQHGALNKNDHFQNGVQHRRKECYAQTFDRAGELQSTGSTIQPGMADFNKPKIRKPCIYFNSSKGCRRGATCNFLHETVEWSRVDDSTTTIPQTKRAKTEIEASGTR